LEGIAQLEHIAQNTGKDTRELRFILEDLASDNYRCVRGFGYGPHRYSAVQVLAPTWYYAEANTAGFDVLETMLQVARVITAYERSVDREELLRVTALPSKQFDIVAQILGAWNLVSLFQPSVRGLAFRSAAATVQTYKFIA
jgi:hypothetical protein